jgi:hypothetical protein
VHAGLHDAPEFAQPLDDTHTPLLDDLHAPGEEPQSNGYDDDAGRHSCDDRSGS